jgi:hypothetical protein
MDKPKQPTNIPPHATPEQIQEISQQHQAHRGDSPARKKKGTSWLYFWLWLLLAMFLVWIGSSLLTLVSHLTFPGDEGWKAPNIIPPIFLIIVISAVWKALLTREPHTDEVFRRKHRRLLLITGALLGALGIVAVFGGMRNGHQREQVHKIQSLMAQISPLADIGNRIGRIKARNLKTTKDYLDAYGEIESLLPEWKKRFGNVGNGLKEVRGYDFDARISSILAADMAAYDLGGEEISLTEKEVLVIHRMSSLPRGEQVAFWNENFKPLHNEEVALSIKAEAIRKQLSALTGGGPSPQK